MNTNQVLAKMVAAAITKTTQSQKDVIVKDVLGAAVDAGIKESAISKEMVVEAANKVLTQDAPLLSKRLWAAAVPVLTGLLYIVFDPSVVGAFIEWLNTNPVAYGWVLAQIVAAVFPILSKLLDPRPTRP